MGGVLKYRLEVETLKHRVDDISVDTVPIPRLIYRGAESSSDGIEEPDDNTIRTKSIEW